MIINFKPIEKVDLTKVIELDDNTNLTGELACAGGACEITQEEIMSAELKIVNEEKSLEILDKIKQIL